MTRPAWLVFIALLLVAAPLAAAAMGDSPRGVAPRAGPAGRNVSYSTWTVDGAVVRLRIVLPKDAARALGDVGKPAPSLGAIANAVHDAFHVTSSGGECAPIDQGEGVGEIYTLALSPTQDRFEMIFVCANADRMVLHDHLLFARAPGQVNYASVRLAGGRPALQIFTAAHQTLALPNPSVRLADAGVGAFATLGVDRALGQAARLCLVAGLLVLALAWRDLAAIAAGLCLGYLASLAAGSSGLAALDPVLTASATGLLVAGLGAGGLALHTAGASPKSPGGRIAIAAIAGLLALAVTVAAALHGLSSGLAIGGLALFLLALVASAAATPRPRWIVFVPAALVGLLDGMSQAADLSPLNLPAARLAPALSGYDLGAAAATIALVAVAMAILWLAARKLRAWRPAAGEIAGAGLVAAGVFWFVSRLYS